MANTIFWVVMIVIGFAIYLIIAFRMTRNTQYQYPLTGIGAALLGVLIGAGAVGVICLIFKFTGLAKTLGITSLM